METLTKKKKNFWCFIGFHKLKYVLRSREISELKCKRCGQRYLEGQPGEIYRIRENN